MLSRVADSLYWMSRYMERCDGMLRMLKINYASSQDDIQEFSWKPALKLFTYLNDEEATELSKNSRDVLLYVVTGKENTNSVLNLVTAARENGRSVQDHITKEMWQCLNDFYHMIREEKVAYWLQKEDPITILDNLLKQCLLYFGTTDVTMARGESHAFINIGKFLERGVQTADILDVKFSAINNESDKAADAAYWKYLLLSISGYELYLKTYRSGLEAKNVVEQSVLNPNFPRSVMYSVKNLRQYFERLKSDRNYNSFNEISFMIGKLESKIKFSTTDTIVQGGLSNFLQDIKRDLLSIGSTLNKNYFAYS
jgi:uncharacterized alpha-E superfamily protein